MFEFRNSGVVVMTCEEPAFLVDLKAKVRLSFGEKSDLLERLRKLPSSIQEFLSLQVVYLPKNQEEIDLIFESTLYCKTWLDKVESRQKDLLVLMQNDDVTQDLLEQCEAYKDKSSLEDECVYFKHMYYHSARKEYDEALKGIDGILKVSSNLALAYMLKAKIYGHKGDTQKEAIYSKRAEAYMQKDKDLCEGYMKVLEKIKNSGIDITKLL
ncbi:hypothetical protein D3C81_08410 [compost metagenome]